MIRQFGPLRNILVVRLFILVLLSIVLTVGAVIWQSRQILSTQAADRFLVNAESTSDRLLQQMEFHILQLDQLAQNPSVVAYLSQTDTLRTLPEDEREAILAENEERWFAQTDQAFVNGVVQNQASEQMDALTEAFPLNIQIVLADRFGQLRAVGGVAPTEYRFDETDGWQAVMDGGASVFLGNLRIIEGQPNTLIDIVIPVYAAADATDILGVIQSRVDLSGMLRFADDIVVGETGEASLVNFSGQYLHSSNVTRVGGAMYPVFVEQVATIPVGSGIDPDERGISVIHSHAAVRNSRIDALNAIEWSIVLQQDEVEALANVRQIQQIALLAAAIGLLLTFVVGLISAQQVSRPVELLTEGASRITSGDTDVTVPVTGPVELRSLARAFNVMTTRMQNSVDQLEDRVQERTALLRASIDIGRAISSILDPDALINEVVQEISDQLDLYYVAIFLLDDSGRWAVLRSATSEGGAELLRRNHRLEVGGQSMVGTAISFRQPRIALDVGVEAVRFDNPLLPDTRSEIALPLFAGASVLGAMDAQSTEPAAFDETNVETLQSLANQVAIALQNAQLYQETQRQLQQIERLNRLYLQQRWDDAAQTELSAIQLQGSELRRVDAINQTLMTTVLETPEAFMDENGLTVPLKLREEVIGALNLKTDGRTLSPRDRAIVEAVANQAAVALENAQLVARTQRRAQREEMINRIAGKIRQATDIEDILQTTLSELSRELNIPAGKIQLGMDNPPPKETTDSNGGAA